MSTLPEGIYQEGEYYRVKRLPRAYNRKRVGGRFATVDEAWAARNAAMGIKTVSLVDDILGFQPRAVPIEPDKPIVDQMRQMLGIESTHGTPSPKPVFYLDTSAAEATLQRAIDTLNDLPAIPDNVNLIDAPPLTLDCTRFLAASDFHVPLHHTEYTRRLLRVAQKHGVEHLIVQGDLFDFASSSRHPKTEQQASLNQTLRIGGDLLVALCGVFKHVYLLPGNHDRRVANKLDEPLSFDMLVHAALRGRCVSQITVTDYDYVYVGSEWVIGHPRYYSSTPAKGGADVALLQQRNVIGSHNHIFGVMQSKCGKFLSIDPGHMTNPDITPYHLQSAGLSRFGNWKNGFVMVENGIVKLFTDGLVDWGNYA